ncbi:MAG: VWA domain-containing protein [Pyrinomonadaceae bacterium]
MHVDLPLGGELRVENLRGGVSVEVWKERYVSVTATVEGVTPVRSPVTIQRTERLLSISVSNNMTTTPARVDLLVHIPERTRAEIVTANGEIEARGVPASLNAQTVSGDIRASLAQAKDIDVAAQSTSGVVSYSADALPASETRTPPANTHAFHIRLGGGSKWVRLRSQSGRITLLPVETAKSDSATEEARKPPVLIGAGNTGSGAGTPASATEQQEVDEGDVIRVDAQLVTLNMSVIDRSTNRGLAGLTQNDFHLYEDGALQEIAHFDSSAAPFNLLLLIDLSGSTKEVVNLIRGAALRFVDSARPNDRIGVITFADAPVIVSPFTDDREALRQRINAMERPHGTTTLYDSIAFAMDQVMKDAKDSRRNAIVLMSDGMDSIMPNVDGDGSRIDYRELLNRVREFDGVLYSLWLNTEYEALSDKDVQPETFDLAYDRMKELAEEGGGIFYEVEKLEDLAGAYERVVADLGTVYSLSYRPTNKARDGKWRAIRLAVSRPNAVARGKRGYYAK